jgi:hypothetical protein
VEQVIARLTDIIFLFPGECTGSAILVVLGIVQAVLSMKAAGRMREVPAGMESPLERNVPVLHVRRAVHGLRILACISFLLAILSVAIPLYVHSKYGL